MHISYTLKHLEVVHKKCFLYKMNEYKVGENDSPMDSGLDIPRCITAVKLDGFK